MSDEKEMAGNGLNDDNDLHELLEPLDIKPINSRPVTCPSGSRLPYKIKPCSNSIEVGFVVLIGRCFHSVM